jgi:hypothetical protein
MSFEVVDQDFLAHGLHDQPFPAGQRFPTHRDDLLIPAIHVTGVGDVPPVIRMETAAPLPYGDSAEDQLGGPQ